MKVIADLEVHSKYARAVSSQAASLSKDLIRSFVSEDIFEHGEEHFFERKIQYPPEFLQETNSLGFLLKANSA